MNTPKGQVPADGWLQDGGLLYRLTDERHPCNRDEINVTMADGSRSIESRSRRALELLDRIRATNPSPQAADLIASAAKSHLSSLMDYRRQLDGFLALGNEVGRAARLDAQIDALRAALASAPAQPVAESAEVLEDAARYRMVRRGQRWSVVDGIGNDLRAEALDSAIDAARAARAPADSAEPVSTWCDGCSPENCGGCHIPSNAAAPAQAPSQLGGFSAGDMASAAAQGYHQGYEQRDAEVRGALV